MAIRLYTKHIMIAIFMAISLFSTEAIANGHKISGTLKNFQGDTVFLAMIYGGHHYVVDTALVSNGNFVFESKFHLHSGTYMVVIPPASSFLILLDEKTPEFRFTADAKDINGTITFDGSVDNTTYYDYLRFFESKRAYLDQVKKEYDANQSEQDRAALLARMQQLKKEVTAYQTDIVMKNPGTLTAAMVRCELQPDMPAFDGSPETIQLNKYLYQKAHYFDNIDLADERLIRSPKNVIVDRIDYYLDQLTMQHPDSIKASVDYILKASEKTPLAYRFYLTHIFNKYREAKNIGMDAIYVHIAENYIAKGKAPWINADERNAVLAAVSLISPTLIGKVAPNFTVQKEDGMDISLHDVKSPYTILFFWSPNCAHCQQSMPKLKTFYETYKTKGVQVLAVCTKVNADEKNCWDFVDKNQYGDWINASDKMGGSSKIHTQYNIKTTPKIYVLDKDKMIIAKDLGVEHLEEVMKRVRG